MTLLIRDIPVGLDAALRKAAEEQHRPVDQVAVEAMKAGLGLQESKPGPATNRKLANTIRARFALLGGVDLAEPIREPIRETLDLGK